MRHLKQHSTRSKFKTDCIGICQRRSGVCTGCGRTNEEIFDWIILSEDEKQAILATPKPNIES